MLRLLKTLISL